MCGIVGYVGAQDAAEILIAGLSNLEYRGYDSAGISVFEDGAIRLAYEKTVLKKQSLNWAYMNSILKNWHAKGLHTVAAIQTGDKPAHGAGAPGMAPGVAPRPEADDRAKADMAQLRRYLEERKNKREEG